MPTSNDSAGSGTCPRIQGTAESVRILVTGADGFVGGHLLRTLAREGGHDVVAGYLPKASPPAPSGAGAGKVKLVPLDVTDARSVEAAIERARPQWVFHLAAQSSVGRSLDDPLGTWEVNATGTLRLAESLRAAGSPVRLLVISSAEVYGAVDDRAVPEEAPLRPSTPYGASKAAAEMAALQAGRDGLVEVVISRSFNHTGPGQEERFVLPSMALQLARMLQGDAPRVLHVGNLEARRDFLDVRDVVKAYRLLVERGDAGQAYNVCSGTALTLREVVDRLVEISGTGATIQVDPERLRPVDIPVLHGAGDRLRELGWRPEIELDTTLRDLFEEARANVAGEAR